MQTSLSSDSANFTQVPMQSCYADSWF